MREQVIAVGKDVVVGTAVGPWSFLVDYKSETQQEVKVGYKPLGLPPDIYFLRNENSTTSLNSI